MTLALCHITGTYIYTGQCCAICCEKLACNIFDFSLPEGIRQLDIFKMKGIPMGNIYFDLQKLFEMMVVSEIDPQKSINEYSELEMQTLGKCYLSATTKLQLREENEVKSSSEELPFE